MRRRAFVFALAGSLMAVRPPPVRAQTRRPRIGYLTIRSPGHELEAAFVAGMRELGYRDGDNIAFEWRFAEGKAERLPALAAELASQRVELIVAASTQAIQAAVKATPTIPVVFPAQADPVGTGIVKSLARPGGNVTGLSTAFGDLGAKQIELLKAAAPAIKRLAVLLNPTNAGNRFVVQSVEAGARSDGLSVQGFEARTVQGIEQAFAAMAAARIDAVIIAIDGFFGQNREKIAALALQHKLPLMSPVRADAEAGALISYGPSLAGNYRRCALYVDRILKGAKPADLPVEQPTTFELAVNLKTAAGLGLRIPDSIRLRADRVIE